MNSTDFHEGQRVLIGSVSVGTIVGVVQNRIRVKIDNAEFYEFITYSPEHLTVIPDGATADQIKALKSIIA